MSLTQRWVIRVRLLIVIVIAIDQIFFGDNRNRLVIGKLNLHDYKLD